MSINVCSHLKCISLNLRCERPATAFSVFFLTPSKLSHFIEKKNAFAPGNLQLKMLTGALKGEMLGLCQSFTDILTVRKQYISTKKISEKVEGKSFQLWMHCISPPRKNETLCSTLQGKLGRTGALKLLRSLQDSFLRYDA